MAGSHPRTREITERDLDVVGDLLTRGFAYRPRTYWMRGLHRQATREVPPNAPRFGYLMEHDGVAVGCLLLIYARKMIDGVVADTCNVSSWYVDPAFRNFGAMFASMVQKRKDVTYFNITPARPTWPILEAQGYVRWCSGQFLALPFLSWRGATISIARMTADSAPVEGLRAEDDAMLRRHAGYGNLSLVCRADGRVMPFIFFQLRKRRGFIPMPAVQLAYCPSISDFAACAGALGRYLLLRGKPIVILDADGPLTGIPGHFSEARGRKYFKGPHRPRLVDLADTELAIYGP
ncbi:acyl-CoA acyltransferase [Bradyrhizobium jicamae]|uniref:Acyl-CoA acyltransferase n=1 Tax=Bradyrhizobium jicamae TaxID=280332 RepID=A0ABS5FQ00_9BRAD|nr:acyl-CoA acyltransferase [Bradyrhizobium jicamae]MBR0798889.1 acyl-CoA acyltransferase [Bradyrhizobium jicamae]